MGTCSMNGARFTVQTSGMGFMGKDEGGGRGWGGVRAITGITQTLEPEEYILYCDVTSYLICPPVTLSIPFIPLHFALIHCHGLRPQRRPPALALPPNSGRRLVSSQ